MADTPLKIKFAPGVLEQLEQEMASDELQAFMDELAQLAADDQLVAKSVPVDMLQLQREDPELYEQINSQLEKVDQNQPKPTLQ